MSTFRHYRSRQSSPRRATRPDDRGFNNRDQPPAESSDQKVSDSPGRFTVFDDIGDPQSIWLRPGEHALDEIRRGGSLVAGPAWYFNVKAHPAITVQDGDKVVELTAREVEGVKREQWWELAVAAYPPYAEYQTKTARLIPVFVLD